MRILLTAGLCCLFLVQSAQAQQKWNLKTCVEYAMANNISVRQADVQAKLSELSYRQSRLSQLPNASFGLSGSVNSGNNQDPVTFSRVTETYLAAGMQLQSSADIFNFYSKRNTIAANQWEMMAARANVDKIKNDIALSVANAYLQVLLAQEQEKIISVQYQQTANQLDMTSKMVAAGTLPPLNESQLQAQLALDSSNLISAKGGVTTNLLNLKALMNVDAGAPFELEAPPVDIIPIEPIADLQPEFVYTQALANQPQQKGNEFRLKAAQKSMDAARGAMKPTLSAFGSLSTNYLAFHRRPFYQQIITGYQSTGLIADAGGGTVYDVKSPIITRGDIAGYVKPNSLGSQMSDNFRKVFGLSINVPIFNGGVLKTAYERSKLNLGSMRLQKEQDDMKLKQDIYQAYNAALVAMQKLDASKKTVDINETTFTYARKRYDVGMLSTFDLVTSQNNLLRARLEYSLNRFDYVFKMKVLEFYKGAGLKL
ncbi:MAG TPA: TolC family protein [Chitinophagaceae bacterium]|nr:TolC family protein [Chitinophagaceae bacterium]